MKKPAGDYPTGFFCFVFCKKTFFIKQNIARRGMLIVTTKNSDYNAYRFLSG